MGISIRWMAWASLASRLEPCLEEGASPQQGASNESAEVLGSSPGWGINGGLVLHPPLLRLLVATATQEQEHLFDRILLGRDRLCFLESEDPRAAQLQRSRESSHSSHVLHREPFQQYSHRSCSLDSRLLLE